MGWKCSKHWPELYFKALKHRMQLLYCLSMQSGKDGDYRMKVDETYETLAKMAKAAKILYKVYLVFVLAKLLWLATPQLVPQHRMDPLQFGVFAVGFGGGVIAWSKAAVGSRFEHFGAVMLFNILTALGVGFVRSQRPSFCLC
jgi:hypothetical protein